MKPFNLKSALKGDRVITRSGKEVIDFHLFNCKTDYPLCGVISFDNNITSWDKNGKHFLKDSNDLFMVTQTKKLYVGIDIRSGVNGIYGTTPLYPTKDELMENYIRDIDNWVIKEIEIEV